MSEERKVALITGGADGLGRVIALRLAEDGYDIALNDIKEEKLAVTYGEILSKDVDCLPLKTDVGSEAQVKAMFEKLVGEFGRIDVLVNNAGVCPIADILEYTPEQFAHSMNVNVNSMYTCAYYAIPHMARQGGGRIINAGSTGSFTQSPTQVAYCTAKWAVRGLTRNLAAAVAKFNIAVNAYCPGVLDTPMQEHIAREQSRLAGKPYEEFLQAKAANCPIGRYIKLEEVAEFVAYLASDKAAAFTGQSILIDGGRIMN